MTTKRELLGQLKRDELLLAADELGLVVEDRRVRAQLIEVLARSRKASLPEILAPLPRARLKELCSA